MNEIKMKFYIVRDQSGDLIMFNCLPIRNDSGAWIPNLPEIEWSGSWIVLDPNLFPEIQWYSNPTEFKFCRSDF